MTGAAPTDFDSELRRHHTVLSRACDIQLGEHVIDIGCGTGQTTRHAARAAGSGSALGVDVSRPSIQRARQFADAAGIPNVTFACADAQTYPFQRDHFDVAVSRFGTMFFEDPTAAFTNIRRALRPGGRLVMLVWQARSRNEWIVAIDTSLEAAGAPLADPSEHPNPFSLADPDAVTEILETAGFSDVAFTDVSEPVFYGADTAGGLQWILGFTQVSETLSGLHPIARERALSLLGEALATHASDDGVWFASRAWIVSALARTS